MKMLYVIAAILITFVFCPFVWSAPLVTHVARFEVRGADKPEQMQSILQTLLISRMAGETITTTDKPDGADVKVSGSYLLSGSVYSIDALAVGRNGDVLARSFVQGKSPDELIPSVGELAKSLVTGIEKSSAAKNMVQISADQAADVIVPTPVRGGKGLVIHRIAGAMNGVALGRILAGGERELFITGNQVLRYYRLGRELNLMQEIPYKVEQKVLAVDAADLDNDKNPEIYVTIMENEVLVSQVWVVDGSTVKQIAGALPYYFRSVSVAGGVKKLYAQKMSGTEDFTGAVLEVSKSGDTYRYTTPVKLPKQGYLYNFSFLRGASGTEDIIIADRNGYLRLFNPAGDELWKSSDEYGGSETHFTRRDFDSLRNSGTINRKVFLDQRMIVKANGEILIAKNAASWSLFGRNSYAKSSLYCFAWDGTELQEKWHTKQNDNYLADFVYDESSRELLMLEVVTKEEGVFDKGASRLVIKKID